MSAHPKHLSALFLLVVIFLAGVASGHCQVFARL